MKSVAVFFDAPGFESYPFDKEEYRTAYHEVGALIQERGGRFFIARGQDTFQGRNMFSGGWEYRDTRFVECGPFTVNLIYDKGYFRTDGASDVLNDRELDTICTDKSKTIALFPELSPKTFTVNDASELRDALSRMNDARVVAKPLDGEEGKGVMIASASEIAAAVTSFPYLIQEFIDTSGGIPGVVEGIHDFRIITIAGDPVLSYVRTPPPGKLTANVAQGGREIHVPLAEIPEGAMRLFRGVDQLLARFPKRVYCVDMGLHSDGSWKIIELNSKPGLTPMRQGADYVRFMHKLVDALLS